jgi:hypothetical protein
MFDEKRWRRVENIPGMVIVGPDHSLPFVSLTLRSNTDREHRRVIGYWYLSEDHPTIDPFYVKIDESLNLLASEKSILSLIAVSTATDVYGPNPQATLESFLSAFCAIEPATEREPTRPPVCGG